MTYEEFLRTKIKTIDDVGFDPGELNPKLYDFQKFIVRTALKKGRYAIFADCGLGKTAMQLEWARKVADHTGRQVLILAPLAVTDQTIEEAEKFDISLDGITITNYEQLDNITSADFVGIVLDESSIIKDYHGAIKTKLIEGFSSTRYKLACSATPSPNDPIEIGSHSEFLNQMSGSEMLSMFFINDGDRSEKWRLKGHGLKEFYRWMSTWAMMLAKPSDIGFSVKGYDLPKLNFFEHKIETEKIDNGELFNNVAVSAITFNAELRRTKQERLRLAANLVNKLNESWVVLVKQNEEADLVTELIPDAVEVRGSDTPEVKKANLLGFAHDKFRVLISKAKILRFGLNYQNCHNMLFASPDFSFESLYQAIRREWRYGQKHEVNIHIITTDTMTNVLETIAEKQRRFETMQKEMAIAMNESISGINRDVITRDIKTESCDIYTIKQGDAIELIRELPDESVGLSIFSPPFSSLYTYSDDFRDLSNCTNHIEFFNHFKFLVSDLLRITKPGRLACLHLTQLTTLKGKDGFYSIVDFRGDVIRLFQDAGWLFHGEVTVWKDPQLAAVRTKCIQLLHKQTKIDSTVSRPGLADYVLAFRRPGENQEPVNHDRQGIPFELWTEYASPVWLDINASDTLQYMSGKGEDDVKHITPTQLEIWKRAIILWSNPGDTIFTPFMGIGSEVYQAVKMGRKGIGFELKESYFEQAKKNIKAAYDEVRQPSLFEVMV